MTFTATERPAGRKAQSALTAVALATSMLCAATLVQAQTTATTSSQPGTDLGAELQRRFEAQEAAIARYLTANPGVQREVVRDGVVYRILRIGSDGQPIYIKSKGGALIDARSNVESGRLIKADSLYPGGSLGVNITGQGMVAGVWESSVPRATHELLAGKVSIEPGEAGDTSEEGRDHATHVTGTIIGRAGLSGDGASAQGIAYSASSRNWDTANDTTEMLAAGQGTNGLLVSNHSYGYANDDTTPLWQFGAYDSESRAWDQVVSSLTYYQPFVAAGNEQQNSGNPDKGGYDLMTGSSAAKNVVAVGALNADKSMSAYSNWGPTDDGRLKPEIVARGTGINSATAASDTSYSGSGAESSGTSYATPAVTAGALLLQQYYNTRYASGYMRSETLRALMFGTTEDLGRPGPDHQFGWGLLNLESAATAIKQRTTQSSICDSYYLPSQLRGALIAELVESGNVKGDGSSCVLSLFARGGVPLVVNLAWNDDAGPEQTAADPVDDPSSRAVYNYDVQVTAIATSTKYRPWKIPDMAHRTDNATQSNTLFDDLGKNFKQVIIANPATDTEYQVAIFKHNASPAAAKHLSLVITGTAISNAPAEIRGTPSVTGTPQVGQSLTGSYAYWDFEDDTEGSSNYRWVWVGPGRGGVGVSRTPIPGATARNYTPVVSDQGKILQFCVYPVAATGNTSGGTGVCSSSTVAVAAAAVNASCGSAANSASTYQPAANLCAVGNASSVTAGSSSWSWSCTGSNGGSNAICSAPFSAVAVGGAVGAIQATSNSNWQIRTGSSGFVSVPATAPAGLSLPLGATKVVLDSGTQGSSATVTLRFSNIPAGAQLYKYGKETGLGDTNKWFPYPATIDAQAGTVTYTLTDGQKGDNDWTPNGVIDDPVALGVGSDVGVSGVPTLSGAAALALSALLAAASVLSLSRRRQ